MGRTGTLIAIDSVLDQIAQEGVVDIAGIIERMRTQRMKMVQSDVSQITPTLCQAPPIMSGCVTCFLSLCMQEQYQFIHDAVLEWLTCGDTQIAPVNLRVEMAQLDSPLPDSSGAGGRTGYEQQFKVL